jgi:hypothetical protein
MSTRVFLPQDVADWISRQMQLKDLGDLTTVQLRLCRRIPFGWLVRTRTFAGLTLWNRVYVIERFWQTQPLSAATVELVLHELVHVVQYRRNPIIFPLRYLVNHIRYGYEKNPAEVEARTIAASLASDFRKGRC